MISLCYRKSTEPLQYWRLENGNVLVFEGNAHTEYSEQEFEAVFEPVNAALHVTEKPTPPAVVARGAQIIDPSR